jgi:hypothetical protein
MGTGPNTQEDATQATGITGFASLTGTRNAQFGMKIDTRPEGVFPMIKKFTNGEPFAIKARLIDSTNAANNAFLLSSPGVKQSANAPTNTNNFQQDDISGYMSCINPDGSEGDQRELVLSYHYSSATAW